MAKKRRPSPTEDDLNRIAETLRNTDGEHKIKDFSSFKKEWKDYFEEDNSMRNRSDLITDTFNIYAEQYPDRLELREKRRKEVKTKPRRKPIRELRYTAREKGRIVYASRETVKIKGKEFIRHRDRFGRFASVKK